jgi:PAS domain-containing protein
MSSKIHPLQIELESYIKTLWPWLREGSLDGVWWWNLENGVDEYMDERFWQVLGYNPAEREHKAAEWQDLIHPDDLEIALANFEAHKQDPTIPYDQVVRYRRGPLRTDLGDSEWLWVRCRGKILFKDDKPWRMLGVHQDVSLLKISEGRLTDELIELLERVEQLEALG